MRSTFKIKGLKMWAFTDPKGSVLLKLSKISRVVEFF